MSQFPPNYLSMNDVYRAPYRLAMLRVEALKSDLPETDWRKKRDWGFHNAESAYAMLSGGYNGTNERNRVPVWYTHCGKYFRDEKYVDECDEWRVSPRDHHTGWYSNEDCSEKVRGITARLPHGKYIAGYEWSSNGERVWFQDVYDDRGDACRAADGHAESYAEACKEDDAMFQAARRLESDNEDALARLKECLALRNNPDFDLRDEARDLIETIRENREKLKTEYAQWL